MLSDPGSGLPGTTSQLDATRAPPDTAAANYAESSGLEALGLDAFGIDLPPGMVTVARRDQPHRFPAERVAGLLRAARLAEIARLSAPRRGPAGREAGPPRRQPCSVGRTTISLTAA
ncbi:hypothetical protein ACFWFF_08380 [Streptomyces sp. NPDC060223]|uniref:hypothetical protein n=1 Tax=unclassified Streptomyces TaxID=2593676 RepID=UPI00363B87C7